MHKSIQIGVIGGRQATKKELAWAEDVGKGIARRGCILFCGGMGGIMEAACRGAQSESGTTVGILPTGRAADGNDFLNIVIPTNLGIARNSVLVRACEGVIAIGGKYGTLSEVAYALQWGIPVASLGSWDVSKDIFKTESPQEAVEWILKQIGT